MTIAQYLRLLRTHSLLVAILTALGAAGALAYSLLATPVYQAQIQMFVSTTGQSTDIADLSAGGSFMAQRVKSYTQLVTSPRVLRPVISRLGLAIGADTLARHVTATSPLDTVLINVTVTDPSSQRASDIANAIGDIFPDQIVALEMPRRKPGDPVKVSLITTRDATPASAPVSPRTSLNLALGLLVGLGLGVGAAVLRDSLDRTVSSRRQAAELAHSPVLGVISDDPQVSERPLIINQGLSPRAEAFRQLRTNIRFLSVDHSVRSLVVTGSVQSEGKTTTAANLAIVLAQNGEQVVLIDADLRRPHVHNIFGLPTGVGLTSVLLGDVPLEVALQPWRDDVPLRILASGPLPPNPAELIASERMSTLIQDLTSQGVTVILDAPPLLPVTDAAVLARGTDGALLVVRAASTKVEQLTAAAEALRAAHASVLGVVLNRMPHRGGGEGGYGLAGYESYTRNTPSVPAPATLPPSLVTEPPQPPEPAPDQVIVLPDPEPGVFPAPYAAVPSAYPAAAPPTAYLPLPAPINGSAASQSPYAVNGNSPFPEPRAGRRRRDP